MKTIVSVSYFLSWVCVFLSVCWFFIVKGYVCGGLGGPPSSHGCPWPWQLSGEDFLFMFLPLLISIALVFIFSSLHDRIVNKKDGLTLSEEASPQKVNRLWYIIPCVLLVVFFIWKNAPDWFNPRPSTLSTNVFNHQAVPVVRNVRINNFGIAYLQTSNSGDSGPVPYQSDWNNDLHFEVTWIELFNEQAWHAEFTVPIERLSTLRAGRAASIHIDMGGGGDLLVWTDQQAMWDLGAGSREITDEHLEPDAIYELCADKLADDDPRRQVLFEGMDEWAVRAMEHQHNSWMTYPHVRRQGESFPPTSRCTPGWSLRHE